MKPVDRVPALGSCYQSLGFPPYKWSVFRTITWRPFENLAGRALAQTKDRREAQRSFIEKREPLYQGKCSPGSGQSLVKFSEPYR